MPVFGKKRIRELEQEVDRLKANLIYESQHHQVEETTLRNQVDFLIREIRKTDDIIFSISQCTDWSQMRPRVAQLTDQMTARKVAESNRINSLITSELHSTYTPSEPKLISKK
jgi:hypothetical protein